MSAPCEASAALRLAVSSAEACISGSPVAVLQACGRQRLCSFHPGRVEVQGTTLRDPFTEPGSVLGHVPARNIQLVHLHAVLIFLCQRCWLFGGLLSAAMVGVLPAAGKPIMA